MTGPYHLDTRWHNSTGSRQGDKETGRPGEKGAVISSALLVSLSPCLSVCISSGRSPRPESGESSRSGIAGSLLPEAGPPRTTVVDARSGFDPDPDPGTRRQPDKCRSTGRSAANAGRNADHRPTPTKASGKRKTTSSTS